MRQTDSSATFRVGMHSSSTCDMWHSSVVTDEPSVSKAIAPVLHLLLSPANTVQGMLLNMRCHASTLTFCNLSKSLHHLNQFFCSSFGNGSSPLCNGSPYRHPSVTDEPSVSTRMFAYIEECRQVSVALWTEGLHSSVTWNHRSPRP